MRLAWLGLICVLLLRPDTGWAAAKANDAPCVVGILPDERDPNDPGPPDETYALRYTTAFESYCWNCVAVRAKRLDAQCPRRCRGLSAEELGCTAGADAADFSVDQLIRRVGREKAQRRLKTLAADPVAKQKAENYFPNGPEEEKAAPEDESSPR
jgi:hypothetical protein